jgi:hypothetical protein
MDFEKEMKYWKEKYFNQQAQFLSLRELYNKTIRDYDQPEIRLLKAQLDDKARHTVSTNSQSHVGAIRSS